MSGKDTMEEKRVNKMPKKEKSGLRSRAKKFGAALAFALGLSTLSSCSDITPESVYEDWEKTESLRESHNSTYESLESLKNQLRDVENKLKNPSLNKTEKRNLENQKRGLVKNINKLQKELSEYYLDWNDAAKKYLENKAKLAGDLSQVGVDSSPNAVDGRLPELPSPD